MARFLPHSGKGIKFVDALDAVLLDRYGFVTLFLMLPH